MLLEHMFYLFVVFQKQMLKQIDTYLPFIQTATFSSIYHLLFKCTYRAHHILLYFLLIYHIRITLSTEKSCLVSDTVFSWKIRGRSPR